MEISAPLSMNKGTLAPFICVMSPATKYFVPVLNDATQIVFSTGAFGEQGHGATDAAAAVFVEDASAAATASGGDAAAAALVGDADAAAAALFGTQTRRRPHPRRRYKKQGGEGVEKWTLSGRYLQ